jgi:uncharacterized membrane protein YobD (UPF0266 family)
MQLPYAESQYFDDACATKFLLKIISLLELFIIFLRIKKARCNKFN